MSKLWWLSISRTAFIYNKETSGKEEKAMNKNKFTLEMDGFGGVTNFKTELLHVARPFPGVKTKELNVVRIPDKYSHLFMQHAAKGTPIPKMLIRAEWNETEQPGRFSHQSYRGSPHHALYSLRDVAIFMQIRDNQEYMDLFFASTLF